MTAVALLLLAADPAGSALPLGKGWAKTATVPSAYATQAAAADADHLYAVSNTHVAVYARATGKLLGTGTSPAAEHLNSAFVHTDGKLYCAHSNYPAKPDRSEILVFDPATRSLTVSHRFPDPPPGSLVWVVHHAGDWWCCFAHYKADNAKTVLVRYAAGFKETARWTFPAKVVADFDGMSASGGLFVGDDELLVSHHHFPVLYRLKLPAAGGELAFVEAVRCPFPGQGIAADPKTGGLVGIDRKAKEIVLARPEK